MKPLPPGWSEVTIGDVTEYVSRGKSPKYSDESALPVVNQRAIRWDGIHEEHLKFVHEAQFDEWGDERFIRDGDILWNSTGTGTIGRACLVRPAHLSPPKVVDSHVTIVRPRRTIIEPRYLFAWIRGPEVQRVVEDTATGTTNQIELSRATVVATRLPLAPLPEQKLIADKLDALLARVNACRERLERVPILLKRFRQAVLAAAARGDLTAEWRAQREASSSRWETCPLRDLVREPLRNGKSVRDGSGPMVLRLSSLRNGTIDCTEAKSGEWGDIDVRRFFVEEGEFLVARGNGSRDLVGRGGLVIGEPPSVAFPDTMIRIRPDTSKILPHFLKLIWDTADIRRQIELVARTTAGIWKVAQADLEAVTIPVPGLEEQREIVCRTDEIFGYTNNFTARCNGARVAAGRLTDSALAKAFRGELVPQDPNHTPVSELLARIEAGQSTGAARPQRKHRERPGKGSKMSSNTDKDSIKAAILGLKTDRFSFDELRAQVTGDYELLKDALFELLAERKPVVRQVFDKETRMMQLVRVKS